MKKLLLILFFILLSVPAYSACDATLTVCPSGCDYDVLNDAVTDLETNCATPTEALSITISGSWSGDDTTQVGVSGIATTATYDLTISTTGDARHDGTAYKSGAYKLNPTLGSSSSALGSSVEYLTIDGLVITYGTSASYNDNLYGISVNDKTDNIIKNNIIYRSSVFTNSGALNWGGIKVTQSSSQTIYYYIYNNIIFGIRNSSTLNYKGVRFEGGINYPTKYFYFYGNTLYDNNIGLMLETRNTNYLYINNNLSIDNDTDFDFTDSNNNFVSNDYNASSDTTATGTNSVTSVTSSVFESTTSGSEDFHLVSGATSIIDKGATLGSPYNVDIDGDSRPQGSAYDIGADEYVASVVYTTIYGATLQGAYIN